PMHRPPGTPNARLAARLTGVRVSRRGVDTWTAWTVRNLRHLGVDSGVDKRGRFVPRGAQPRQLGEPLLAWVAGLQCVGRDRGTDRVPWLLERQQTVVTWGPPGGGGRLGRGPHALWTFRQGLQGQNELRSTSGTPGLVH